MRKCGGFFTSEKGPSKVRCTGQVGAGAEKTPQCSHQESAVGPVPDIPEKVAWEM